MCRDPVANAQQGRLGVEPAPKTRIELAGPLDKIEESGRVHLGHSKVGELS